MTPGRLSRRTEFTPVPSHGSTFSYMIPPQNVMPARVTPAWFHLDCCTGARISLRYACILSTWSVPSNSEIRKWRSHHVNAIRNLKFIPVWNSRWCEFSRVNTRLFNPRLGLAAAYPGRGVLGWAYPSCGLPWRWKCLYRYTQTLSAACWSRERLLRCFQ